MMLRFRKIRELNVDSNKQLIKSINFSHISYPSFFFVPETNDPTVI